jgi:hypothetical protein
MCSTIFIIPQPAGQKKQGDTSLANRIYSGVKQEVVRIVRQGFEAYPVIKRSENENSRRERTAGRVGI